MAQTPVFGVSYAIERERRLAALHRLLSSELGQADYDGAESLSARLQAALWALGSAIEEGARLTQASDKLPDHRT